MERKFFSKLIIIVLVLPGCGIVAQEKANNPVPVEEAQHAWKLAAEQATSADMISVPEGFAVDLVRSAGEDEGSWITVEFDDKNHLYVAKEDKGIYRFTLDANGNLIEPLLVEDTIAQCRGLLWAHKSLYVNSNNPNPPPMKVLENSDGLFRLKDNDGDGVFESKVKMLETSQGSPGHGRNQMKLGPDGLIYFMSGYDVFLTDKVDEKSFLRNFDEDQLIPNPWDRDWFNKHAMAPGGHLIRMDENGEFFQLIAGGFRNPMDIAFNKDGEIFTYDADMEWDAALAWYKPTRVLHVVSGADYGWRRGTGKLPEYYEDSLPSVVDVGLGSPTGLEFGYQSNFPGKWKNALFTGDWTYGRILAVHVEERGSSFGGEFETFAAGRPMNVVDLTFGPDGNMYFVTGGMKTRSGIYRVRWTGDSSGEETVTKTDPESEESLLRNLRYQLEFFQVIKSKKGAQLALHHINHPDVFIRHAARIALENQDPEFWEDQALAGSAPAAFTALARLGGSIEKGKLVKRMNEIDLGELNQQELLGMLRAYQLEFARNGKPSGRLRSDAIRNMTKLFPHQSSFVNYELTELLVYLEDSAVLDKLCDLIEGCETTEDLSQYLVYSRYLHNGWDLESKRTFLKGVQRLEAFPGGKFHQKVINFLREEMLAKLSEPEKVALAKWTEPIVLEQEQVVADPPTFVKAWTVEDFAPHYSSPLAGRDFDKGRLAYSKANCATCHKMQGNQASMKGILGPDLSNVGGRFGVKDLLVSIIHPSRAINDKYRNPAAPNLSTMPPGQINVLAEDEVLDLIAYLQAGGRKEDSVYTMAAVTPKKVAEPKPVDLPGMAVVKDEVTIPDNSPISTKIKSHFFERNSAANTDDRKRLYEDLRRVLDMYPGATFELIGHADDSQYSKTNLDISTNRAKFTALNMIYRGIPKSAISYRAVGDKDPSPEGSRKVEVIVNLSKE
ncbi:MAG: c-type cytochrome [Verrucomicrobiales bacterium]|nr:c-type cytochrome [Verrucomicrobiales bacterium]